MAEVYIRDDILPKDYDGKSPRRTNNEIQGIISGIIPRPPKSSKQTKLGYRVFYENDSDINHFFKPDILKKLKESQLTPQLSYSSQEQRELYIIDIPTEIYKKADSSILVEIEHSNNITILILEKFTSNKTDKKYLKLTLDSKVARDNIINNGSISIFDAQLTALPRKSSKATTASGIDPPQPTLNPWQRISSAQQHGQALPSSSNWAGTRRKQQNTAYGNNHHPKPGLLPTPTGLSLMQKNACTTSIKLFMEATGVICEKLQSGLEDPEFFVFSFNEILNEQGYPTVTVPQDLIDASKIIFNEKNANNILPTTNFNHNTNFHSPTILQHSNAPMFQPHPQQGYPNQTSSTSPLTQATAMAPPQSSTSTGATLDISNSSTGSTLTNTTTTAPHLTVASISALLDEARPPPMPTSPITTTNSSDIPSQLVINEEASSPLISPPKSGPSQNFHTDTPDLHSLTQFPYTLDNSNNSKKATQPKSKSSSSQQDTSTRTSRSKSRSKHNK